MTASRMSRAVLSPEETGQGRSLAAKGPSPSPPLMPRFRGFRRVIAAFHSFVNRNAPPAPAVFGKSLIAASRAQGEAGEFRPGSPA